MGLLRRIVRAVVDRPMRLLLFAWILPVGLMVYNVVFYQSQINSAAYEDFASVAKYSAGIVQERASELAGALKRSSYDNTIELSYRRYTDGLIDRDQYYSAISGFMNNAWSAMTRLRYALVITNADASPDGVSDTVRLSFYGEAEPWNFGSADLPAILQAARNAGGGVGLLLGEERDLYFYHNLLINVGGDVRNIGIAIFCYNTAYSFNVLTGDKFPQKHIYMVANGVPLHMTADAKYELYNWDFSNVPDKPTRVGKMLQVGGSFSSSDLKITYLAEIEASYLTADSSFYMRVMGIIALMFGFILMYYNLISTPVRRLTKAIGAMELSTMGVRTDMKERNEFRFLFGAFEGLANRLVALQEQTYKEELAARDAKIDSLTSQINPHFINNLLELISWQARLGDAKGVSRMIDSMIVIMEAAMNREHIKAVDLAVEVGYAHAYLNIIHERYGKKLMVNIEVPSPLPSVSLPPLIIQPMLENAVKHGIDPNGGGHITMRVTEETGCLRVDVLNSGRPMNDSDKRRVNAALSQEGYKGSIGIRNVMQRLKLVYGDAASLEVFSVGRDTVSRLRIPLINESTGIVKRG